VAERLAEMGATKMTAVVAKCNSASRAFCQKIGAVEEDLGNTMPVFSHLPNVPTVHLPIVQVHWSEGHFDALIQ
jgi:hypothetical protein